MSFQQENVHFWSVSLYLRSFLAIWWCSGTICPKFSDCPRERCSLWLCDNGDFPKDDSERAVVNLLGFCLTPTWEGSLVGFPEICQTLVKLRLYRYTGMNGLSWPSCLYSDYRRYTTVRNNLLTYNLKILRIGVNYGSEWCLLQP